MKKILAIVISIFAISFLWSFSPIAIYSRPLTPIAEAGSIGMFQMNDSSAYIKSASTGRIAAIIGYSPNQGNVIFKFTEQGSRSGRWYKTCARVNEPNTPYFKTWLEPGSRDQVLEYIIRLLL